MTYDDTLVQLQQKVAMKKAMDAKLNDLHNQRREYDRELNSLRVAFHKEQEDVVGVITNEQLYFGGSEL